MMSICRRTNPYNPHKMNVCIISWQTTFSIIIRTQIKTTCTTLIHFSHFQLHGWTIEEELLHLTKYFEKIHWMYKICILVHPKFNFWFEDNAYQIWFYLFSLSISISLRAVDKHDIIKFIMDNLSGNLEIRSQCLICSRIDISWLLWVYILNERPSNNMSLSLFVIEAE